MLQFILKDHSLTNYIPIDFIRNISSELVKQESQVFPGKEFSYNPALPTNKTISNSNRGEVIDQVQNGIEKRLRINSPISELDYAGIINQQVKYIQDEDFITVTYFKEGEWVTTNLFVNDLVSKLKTAGGNQFLILNSNTFDTYNPDTNSYDKNYGIYYIVVEPLYIETTVSEIEGREHITYGTDLVSAGVNSSRHTQYTLDITNFRETKLVFERSFNGASLEGIFSNRLVGSLVYCKNTDGTDKNVKVITNDYFDFNNGVAKITMAPDYMGIDSPFSTVGIGDKIRIYPKECYFTPITIRTEYLSTSNAQDIMRQYNLNDAVRDLQTNIIEVYDDNGLTINPDGGIDGRVIFSYQISQEGTKEVKRKI